MKNKIKNIGIETAAPKLKSNDKNDPFVSSLKLRGRMFIGTVVATNATRTAKVEFERIVPLQKFERFEKRRTRLIVHNPDSIQAKVGDRVRLVECRPISKTKNFTIIERLQDESNKK